MRMMFAAILAVLLVPMARGQATAPATPAGVVSNFIREVSALATNHAELADFPEYVKRLQAQSAIEFQKDIRPFAVSFDKNITPVITKRRIRPSDCGTNGILLQFVLDDGTNPRQAPLDTVTYFPNLKLTLYAEVVLWENAQPELKKTLEGIIGRNKAMLKALDKKTNTVETVCWGERTNGLQLSITAMTNVITTSDKLMVHLRARNLSADRMNIDAAIPSGNGSEIDVIHPDGNRGGLNVWADRIMSTVLVPGENDLGVYDVTGALDKLGYNTKKVSGVHKITWVLQRTRSNSIDIKLE